MSPFLLSLLIASAAIHTGWNLLLKNVDGRSLVAFWANAVSAAVFLPLLAIRPQLSGSIWLLALASAAAEAVYYLTLMSAYRVGDFSVVYPVARGAAPAFLAIGAVLFLGERPRPGGLMGLLLIVAGLLTVGSAAWQQKLGEVKGKLAPGVGLALLVALLIACYSLIDGSAVKRSDPVAYVGAVYGLTVIWLAPFMLRQFGWRAIRDAWAVHAGRAAAIGGLQGLGYGTVLYVFSKGSVSYAGAIRESSVVFGALAGWLWLGEEFGVRRLLGALVMLAGVIVIAVTG